MIDTSIYTPTILEKLRTGHVKSKKATTVHFYDRKHYISQGIGYIQASTGDFAMCDAEDFEELTLFSWNCTNRGKYFSRLYKDFLELDRFIGKSRINMSDHLMKCPPDKVVDHMNGNTLDNRKNNLRIVTFEENLINRGKRSDCQNKYKGVSPRGKAYTVTFTHVCKTEEEAAKLWDKFAKICHGPYARLNFPDG